MAGVLPKLQRQRRQTPAGGDWKVLEPLTEPVLPDIAELGEDTEWSFIALAYWEAWRGDPVTGTWNSGDIALALDTLTLIQTSRISRASEIRQRLTSLGLTPKGRDQLRMLHPDDPRAEIVRPTRRERPVSTSPARRTDIPVAV